ncbi:hypothetical protein HG531_000722 [Fusarium graminearum]|nr:hypothetical protein HG531_000722 [Fusarium graminearum]
MISSTGIVLSSSSIVPSGTAFFNRKAFANSTLGNKPVHIFVAVVFEAGVSGRSSSGADRAIVVTVLFLSFEQDCSGAGFGSGLGSGVVSGFDAATTFAFPSSTGDPLDTKQDWKESISTLAGNPSLAIIDVISSFEDTSSEIWIYE